MLIHSSTMHNKNVAKLRRSFRPPRRRSRDLFPRHAIALIVKFLTMMNAAIISIKKKVRSTRAIVHAWFDCECLWRKLISMAVFEMNLCDVYHLFILYCNIVTLYKNKITVYVIFVHFVYLILYNPRKNSLSTFQLSRYVVP